jgi:hypothetical protein
MGPGALESNVTPDLLKEAGYTHLLDWPLDDQPIWMQTRAGSLLSPLSDGIERCRARRRIAITPAANSPR